MLQHGRLNYGQPRWLLVEDGHEARSIARGLSKFFARDEHAAVDRLDWTPADFLEKHPDLTVGSEDERDLENVIDYDEDNPHHLAWMKEVRALLAD
jgi:hypothetical protein